MVAHETDLLEQLHSAAAVDTPEAPSFSGAEQLAVAGRVIMLGLMQQLSDQFPGVLAGDDPEAIHHLSVTTGQLRAYLQSTAPAFRRKMIADLHWRLGKLTRAVEAVRQHDALLSVLHASGPQHDTEVDPGREMSDQQPAPTGNPAKWNKLITRQQTARDRAHTKLVQELSRKRTERLLADLTAFLTSPLEEVIAKSAATLPLLVRHHAGSAIWHAYEAVWRFETVLPQASEAQLHQLGIAGQQLRYTLELFALALGVNVLEPITHIAALQEQLSKVHDTDVIIATLSHRQRRQTHGGRRPAMSALNGQQPIVDDTSVATPAEAPAATELERLVAEHAALLAGVEPLWQQVTSETSRRALAQLIAAL